MFFRNTYRCKKKESKQWDGEHWFQVTGNWWGRGPGGQPWGEGYHTHS